MTVEVEELIRVNLEKQYDIVITSVVSTDELTFDVEGFGKEGAFKAKMALILVELGTTHAYPKR